MAQKHRGEIVEKVVRNSGYPFTRLADKLSIARRTIYNKFEDANLDYEFILRIGRIIGHDFTEQFPQMFNPAGEGESQAAEEPLQEYDNSDNFYKPQTLKECERALLTLQSKYISLLETHQDLLKQLNQSK